MDKEKNLPKRKDLRLRQFDYSSAGAYFVTICTKDKKKILSDIVKPSTYVGAHDESSKPQIQLTEIGKIAEKYLLSTENIRGVKIDQYVIMPEHIHVIIIFYAEEYVSHGNGSSRAPTRTDEECVSHENGSSRAPTRTNEMLPHVISTFKRFCNKEIGNNIFQRGYMEHIIRDRKDYETRVKYIYENPIRRYYDENKPR